MPNDEFALELRALGVKSGVHVAKINVIAADLAALGGVPQTLLDRLTTVSGRMADTNARRCEILCDLAGQACAQNLLSAETVETAVAPKDD